MVRYSDGDVPAQECRFTGGAAATQRFDVVVPRGVCAVSFVFLPGSRFDFEGFRFERSEEGE